MGVKGGGLVQNNLSAVLLLLILLVRGQGDRSAVINGFYIYLNVYFLSLTCLLSFSYNRFTYIHNTYVVFFKLQNQQW